MTWCFRWTRQSTTDQAWACPLRVSQPGWDTPERHGHDVTGAGGSRARGAQAETNRDAAKVTPGTHMSSVVSQALVASCLVGPQLPASRISLEQRGGSSPSHQKTHQGTRTKSPTSTVLFLPHPSGCPTFLLSHHFFPKPCCHQAPVPSSTMP